MNDYSDQSLKLSESILMASLAMGGGTSLYVGCERYMAGAKNYWIWLLVGAIILLLLFIGIYIEISQNSPTKGAAPISHKSYNKKRRPRILSSRKDTMPGWEDKIGMCVSRNSTDLYSGKFKDIGYKGAAENNVTTNIYPWDYENRPDIVGLKPPKSFLPGIPAGMSSDITKHKNVVESKYTVPPHASRNPSLVRSEIGERIIPFGISNVGIKDRVGRPDLVRGKYADALSANASPKVASYSDYHNPFQMDAYGESDKGPAIETTEWKFQQLGFS